MPAVDVPSGPIRYVERGAGPPVVLLHGLLINGGQGDAARTRPSTRESITERQARRDR